MTKPTFTATATEEEWQALGQLIDAAARQLGAGGAHAVSHWLRKIEALQPDPEPTGDDAPITDAASPQPNRQQRRAAASNKGK